MPYEVTKSDSCPVSKPWACQKTDGTVMGCHETKEDAEAQMAALMSSEGEQMNSDATKDVRERRAIAAEGQPGLIPCGEGRSQPFPGTLRAKAVERDGQEYFKVEGYASVVERGYEMWDMFGPYTEVVAREAFDQTLSANPDVAFLVNHRGVTMARTANGSLELSVDDQGLKSVAYLNPKRQDVKDLKHAIEDGDITEMSFAFVIEEGWWSEDFSQFRITRVNLDRGDVSAVNYGANPHTSIAARSREILDALDKLPAGAARAAMDRLNSRDDLAEDVRSWEREAAAVDPSKLTMGPSVALVMADLLSDED